MHRSERNFSRWVKTRPTGTSWTLKFSCPAASACARGARAIGADAQSVGRARGGSTLWQHARHEWTGGPLAVAPGCVRGHETSLCTTLLDRREGSRSGGGRGRG
eukprot:7385416-Prymnesium_polylepis.1